MNHIEEKTDFNFLIAVELVVDTPRKAYCGIIYLMASI